MTTTVQRHQLPADLRGTVPWASAMSRTDGDCPLLGQEHDLHWFPHPDGGSQHCIGWHAMTRDITRTTARFHPRYLRGRQSNLIHRSTHEGDITWFPDDFHEYGPCRVVFWEVRTVCGPWLRNPQLLDGEGVRAAAPHDTPTSTQGGKYVEITLCRKCFPGTDGARPFEVAS